jgi:hypothetical protein
LKGTGKATRSLGAKVPKQRRERGKGLCLLHHAEQATTLGLEPSTTVGKEDFFESVTEGIEGFLNGNILPPDPLQAEIEFGE